MSATALVSATTLAAAFAAVLRRRPRRVPPCVAALRGPLGVTEAEIVGDLAASFETREG